MKECKHLLDPAYCAFCLGKGDYVQEASFEKKDYVLCLNEQLEEDDAFTQWQRATGGFRYKEVPQMGIRAAGTQVRLDTLVGKLIGLRYQGSDTQVTTDYGTRTAARAQVVDLDVKRNKGVTLIFQEAIANEVRSQGSDWVVGTLRHEEHPTKPEFTMYVLDSENLDLEEIEAAFAEAGIDPNA